MAGDDVKQIRSDIGKLRGEIAELRRLVELVAKATGIDVPGVARKKVAPKRKKKKGRTDYFP